MNLKLKLHNTLSKKIEIFEPTDRNSVKMYVCGPTVYDYAHIGNARSVVVYDILYRILINCYGKNCVKYVRNITDIDDKIINKAKELNCSISEVTSKTTAYFHEHMSYLNCLSPNFEPKATEHLNEMFKIVQLLIDKGFAYLSNKHVYFEVSKYAEYTELSGRSLWDMYRGVRIEIDKNKRQPYDFVLWKPAENTAEVDINYESPWGLGRPGWHIECSAMSYKYLGESFDIHGGGADLIFPHHTNEIAQSRCAFENSDFAKFWVHNGFLTVNGEKMSKSLGNFITVKDLIDKRIAGDAMRLFLISGKYRHPLDYNEKAISDAKKILDYWHRAVESAEIRDFEQIDPGNQIDKDFLNALLEDINTPLAIKIINDYAKQIHASSNLGEKKILAASLISCAKFIGLMNSSLSNMNPVDNLTPEIQELLNLRQEAKNAKDWKTADKIRADLLKKNIKIEDHQNGVSTIKILANSNYRLTK